MGVVLADFVPSWIRLYISTLLIKLSQRDVTSASDVWREFRTQYYAATEAKNINDMATMIHLARISGVEQLSIFTSQPLSSEAVQKLNRALLLGYKTKVVLAQQDAEEEQTLEIQGDEQSWSRYTVLRRRTACGCTKGSDSSSTSWPGSPASSDSEAGPCSLDETMASSYTADNDAQMVSFDATVHIRIGLLLSSKAATPDTKRFKDEQGVEPLQVNLLSQEDGHERFAQLISQQIHHRAETYFCDILLADINSAASNATKRRFSTSSLRKAWVCKRQAFTSKLTVAELDRSLAKTGYMGEPELVVVFGGKPRLRKLYGFPAWPIRLSDLFFDAHVRSNRAYDSSDFVKALRKLAKTEHRYGR
nr:putative protein [Melanopsichium pennsylvanicum 4]